MNESRIYKCMNIHSSTRYSPYFLIHSRDPVLPLDNILQSARVKFDVEFINRLNQVFVTVKDNLAKTTEQRNQIIEIKSSVTYKIKELHRHKEQIVRGNRLKLYKPHELASIEPETEARYQQLADNFDNVDLNETNNNASKPDDNDETCEVVVDGISSFIHPLDTEGCRNVHKHHALKLYHNTVEKTQINSNTGASMTLGGSVANNGTCDETIYLEDGQT
ncbi:hypothetical protein ILUMI_03043 [Ignelater luminosus]|uniref:Uncharacterized protein n=1 Tax=Ignelater luminosus TaxID=2038154 RepID=A0A8K0DH32_IGNLU|nr:hypothetical protein ILUMI_03043 [Ignelater luminosus]